MWCPWAIKKTTTTTKQNTWKQLQKDTKVPGSRSEDNYFKEKKSQWTPSIKEEQISKDCRIRQLSMC